MKIVYPAAQAKHHPAFYFWRGVDIGAREVPERAAVLLKAVEGAGHEVLAPDDFGAAPREKVHSAAYLTFLETVHARWSEDPKAASDTMPSIHPVRYMSGMPEHVVGQIGWFCADKSCPIGEHTWIAACESANAAVHAARLVQGGETAAYALCRPPGHHCYADLAGGFCYLNNVAIAAEDMRNVHERVAIVDIDVHHGNGTQGIFYDRGDVFFASVHADPANFYPFFAGYAEETGADAGAGATLNKPLPLGSGDDPFLAAIDEMLAAIDRFDPGAVLVSLGLDASKDDPFAGLAVTVDGFARAGRAIAALDRPTILIQEGGYLSATLGDNLVAFLAGIEETL